MRFQTKPNMIKPFFVSNKTKFIFKGSLILTDRGKFNNGNGGIANIGYFPDTENFQGDIADTGW